MENINIDLPPRAESLFSDIERTFISMRASGASINNIAKTLKKSTHTICDWNKKYAQEILNIRYSEFCELQKKVIDLKSSRLNFIKEEVEKVEKIIKRTRLNPEEPIYDYETFLHLYFKLSDRMANYESEMLSVGVRYKDNIFPETNEKITTPIENPVTKEIKEISKKKPETTLKSDIKNKYSAYKNLSKKNIESNDSNTGNTNNTDNKDNKDSKNNKGNDKNTVDTTKNSNPGNHDNNSNANNTT